jgi:hypothetical protein
MQRAGDHLRHTTAHIESLVAQRRKLPQHVPPLGLQGIQLRDQLITVALLRQKLIARLLQPAPFSSLALRGLMLFDQVTEGYLLIVVADSEAGVGLNQILG